jgi:hypothetical protein
MRLIGLAVVLVVSLLAPLAVETQPAGSVRRIGYLAGGSAKINVNYVDAFRQGLRERGWVEGQNIVVEYRHAEGRFDRLSDLAAELVRLKVELIFATPTPAAVAARNVTRTIPIVMRRSRRKEPAAVDARLPGGRVALRDRHRRSRQGRWADACSACLCQGKSGFPHVPSRIRSPLGRE